VRFVPRQRLPRPDLTPLAGRVSAFSMVQSLWEHGGGMLSRMVSRNVAWQTLTRTKWPPDRLPECEEVERGGRCTGCRAW